MYVSEALEARRLVELRDRWLNPPEWVEWVDEPVPGYPKRPIPRDEDTAKALKKRTLTNLYNARPQWLADAHEALDAAVAAAYGWSADISDGEVLRELLAMNGGGRHVLIGPWTGPVVQPIPVWNEVSDEGSIAYILSVNYLL